MSMNEQERAELYRRLVSTFFEVPGHWGIGTGFPPLTDEEFDGAVAEVERALSKHGHVGFEPGSHFVVVEDCYGDRTIKVEVIDASKFTDVVIASLQQALGDRYKLWCLVVTASDNETYLLLVHPEVAFGQQVNAHEPVEVADVLHLWQACYKGEMDGPQVE